MFEQDSNPQPQESAPSKRKGQRLKRWLPFGLLVSLLLIIAVACGGSDAEDGSGDTATEEETDDAADEAADPTFQPTPSDDGEMADEEEEAAEEEPDSDALGSGDGDGPGTEASGTEPGSGGDDNTAEGPGVGPKVEGTRAPAQAPEPAAAEDVPERAEGDSGIGDTTTTAAEPPVEALPLGSRLTAGVVDDNAEWDAYLTYLQNYQGPLVYPLDVSERHRLVVLDSLERPVLAALVTVFSQGTEVARLRTHSDGGVYLFPNILPAELQSDIYELTVEVSGIVVDTTVDASGTQREWFISHPGGDDLHEAVNLDVLFLLDATGSMGDEIQQLKDNIEQIAQEIDALPSQPDVRFGMVIYRDRGDEFVVRTYDFTPDVDIFALLLDDVVAAGGGDYPEDLNEALNQAVVIPEWRVENTVSLMFLVADAPPHLDYQDQELTYIDGLQSAVELGVKIFPIATSNLDAQGEYIFRQLAQVSGGQFIFLTYGEGGPGTTGDETDLEVEGYTVSALDELVVQIVAQELSFR